MPEISVIVPVYKVEKYIVECIESILNQTFSKFELILIDDGSPDNCGKICDQYAEIDERVIVIHQHNAGVSYARNVGLDICRGKYITFIDSDDMVNQFYLEYLYDNAIESKADIVVCGTKEFKDTKDFKCREQLLDDNQRIFLCSGNEAVLSIYSEKRGRMRTEPWAKLYAKYLFNNVRFPVGMRYEDYAIVPILMQKSELVIWTDVQLYGYRQRDDSFMHKHFSLDCYEELKAIDNCIEHFYKVGELELVNAVQRCKEAHIAFNSLKARKEGIYHKVPREYQMSRYQAIKKMKALLPYDMYSYRLHQVYPLYILIESHIKRALQVFGIGSEK